MCSTATCDLVIAAVVALPAKAAAGIGLAKLCRILAAEEEEGRAMKYSLVPPAEHCC